MRYVVSAAAPPAALLSGLSPPSRPGQELLLRVLNFMTALEVTCAGLGLGLGLGLVRVRVGARDWLSNALRRNFGFSPSWECVCVRARVCVCVCVCVLGFGFRG